MKYYVGIDLGTTNSAICSYDGEETRVWKSPDQNDVTPSAIFIDKRGNRYYGRRAYDNAPRNPRNSATLFKRFMGTGTKISLTGAGIEMTPEECSAEILKVLYGYLPEEIRNQEDTAVVITVPAAFNQMKKNATLDAAKLAGFCNVALMQEPVAAIMSVMRHSKNEGVFLIYDLGGGTFDVSLAENIGGRVNILANGGIEMCGGRDWDRMIFSNIVVPWLKSNFDLPDDLLANSQYKSLINMAQWAAEKAKIELSSQNSSIISLSESEIRCEDLNSEEIYLDIPVERAQVDALIEDMVQETIVAARDTLAKAGMSANDIDRIVFVGGPTNYKPLRDKVCSELSIKSDTSVNPMTAVAEGASIYAESIDWASRNHGRKSTNSEMNAAADIRISYKSRTPDDCAKIVFLISGNDNYYAEIRSADTGWVSGRTRVANRSSAVIPLTKSGENTFIVTIFDKFGNTMPIPENRIVITQTVANIGAIPAAHSVGIEAMTSIDGKEVLEYIVRQGDELPQKGKKVFRAGQTVKAGSTAAFSFKLYEGEIEAPVQDNHYIGALKISGMDFEEGVVVTGAEIICEYEMADSGAIKLEVSIPSIGAAFGNRDFYSRQEAENDTLNVDRISDDGEQLLSRIEEIRSEVKDERLVRAQNKAKNAFEIKAKANDPEEIQRASNDLQEAKKLIYETRKEHRTQIRQLELNNCVEFFDEYVREYAKQTEIAAFINQKEAAQRSINRDEEDFEELLFQLKTKNFAILWRQDWFVVLKFNLMIQSPANYRNRAEFERLKANGQRYMNNDRIDELRNVVSGLVEIEINDTSIEDYIEKSNIIKG